MIDAIKQAGYQVFVRPSRGEPTYCFFTDGTRIGYAQWSDRVSVSTVHQPNSTTGTGFQFADTITPETLAAALTCHAPHWASRSDRERVDAGNDHGVIHDINGNRIGEWSL